MRSTGGGREKKEIAAAKDAAGRGKDERAMPELFPEDGKQSQEKPL